MKNVVAVNSSLGSLELLAARRCRSISLLTLLFFATAAPANAWDEAIDADFEDALFEGLAAEDCFGESGESHPACALSLLQSTAKLHRRETRSTAGGKRQAEENHAEHQSRMLLLPTKVQVRKHEEQASSLVVDRNKDSAGEASAPGIMVDSLEAGLPLDAKFVVTKALNSENEAENSEGLSMLQATAQIHELSKQRRTEQREMLPLDPEDEDDVAPVSLLQTGFHLKQQDHQEEQLQSQEQSRTHFEL